MEMHIRKSGDPDILVLRWPLLNSNRLVGVLFCWLIGPAIFGGGMGWWGHAEVSPEFSPWTLRILGGLLTVAGLVLLITRHDITIDRRKGIVTNRWRILLVATKRKEYDFSDFNGVTVGQVTRSGNRFNTTCYPIRLVGPEAELELDATAQIPTHSFRLAEVVAKFMGLELLNASGG